MTTKPPFTPDQVMRKMDELQEKYGDENLYDDMWFELSDWLMEQHGIKGRGNTQ